MKRAFALLLVCFTSSLSMSSTATPSPNLNSIKKQLSSQIAQSQKAPMIYQEASMQHANWMYVGFAPRMQDPERLKVIISKRGYTLRVWAQFNEQEIADYPLYLVERFDEINQIRNQENLHIPQQHLFDQYAAKVESIRQDMLPEAAAQNARFDQGLALLKKHFPKNVVVKSLNNGEREVHLHLVYPITTYKDGMGWPQAKTYRVYNFQERRATHTNGKGKIKDYIFSGFPAFWIDPQGKGTGVHGPIRYSKPVQNGWQKGPYGGSRDEMARFWNENNMSENPEPRKGLDVRLRWDVVRTNNSEACFRSEPLELRAVLPAEDDPKPKDWITEQPRLMNVPFQVIDTFDKVTMDPAEGEKIVNIDYYIVSPYQLPDKEEWIRKHVLSYSERKLPEEQQAQLVQEFIDNSYNFPYLEPRTLEFFTSNGEGSYSVMSDFNRAPQSWFYRYCSDWDYRNKTKGCM